MKKIDLEQKREELATLLECSTAVDAFYNHHKEFYAKESPVAVHWTIANLLKAGAHRQRLQQRR